jgi:hypothetical protein
METPMEGRIHADLAETRSINNKDSRPTFGTGAVRATVVVGHVITCSSRNSQTPTVLVLNDHLTRNNEGQMAFVTPVVANIRRTIFNHPKLNFPKLARAHGGSPGFPWVF